MSELTTDQKVNKVFECSISWINTSDERVKKYFTFYRSKIFLVTKLMLWLDFLKTEDLKKVAAISTATTLFHKHVWIM